MSTEEPFELSHLETLFVLFWLRRGDSSNWKCSFARDLFLSLVKEQNQEDSAKRECIGNGVIFALVKRHMGDDSIHALLLAPNTEEILSFGNDRIPTPLSVADKS